MTGLAVAPLPHAVAVALPAIVSEPVVDPAACKKLWINVLIAVLDDMPTESAALAYLRSTDGRMVLAFAGVDGFRRIDLAGMRDLRSKLRLNRADRVLSDEEQQALKARRAAKKVFRAERKIRRAAERDARMAEASNV